jgi:hypothetical protein
MPELTDEQVEQIADEISEAIPAIRQFFSLPRSDQIRVGGRLFDRMVGTDETAQLKSLPMMNPQMLETLTDMIGPLAVGALIKWLAGDPIEDGG